jgi:single-stranded DNA-binding protein
MKQFFLRQIYRSSIAFITTALLASSLVLPQTALAAQKVETHADAVPSIFWLGEYFNNATLSGSPVFRRNTRSIAFNWGSGSPSRYIARDNFSARWTRTFNLPSGVYRFRAVSDDGVRVWVDNTPVIDAWADGPARVHEADVTLSGLRTVRVEYYERSSVASIRLTIGFVSATSGASSGNDWRAEYFNNLTLEGSPSLVRQDAAVNFDWGTGSPNPQVIADGFSARWTRKLNGVIPGYYNIGLRVDDGARVFVDGNLVVNEWRDGAPRNVGANVYLTDGSTMRVEYYDRSGGALIQLSIFPASAPAPAPTATTVATATPAPSYPNWRGEYYNNPDLSGSPVLVRNDTDINFDWGTGSPDGRVQADNFSARWTGRPQLGAGNYRITVRVDDGARVYINGQVVINAWFDGPPRDISADFSVGSTPPEVRVEYYDRGGGAQVRVTFTNAFPTSFADWKAEYFNNTDLAGSPAVVRNDTSVNFDWGTGSPDSRITLDNFSARWTRRQNFGGGVYRIEATMDDGMRVFVDGNLVLNEWRDASARTRTVDVTIGAGDHDLKVEYYDRGFSAVAKFSINRAPVTVTPTAAPIQTPVPTLTPLQVPTASPTLTPIP